MVCSMTDRPARSHTEHPPATPVRPDPAKIIVPRKHGQILAEPPLSAVKSAAKTWHSSNHNCELTGFTLTHAQMIALARQDLWRAAEAHAKAIGISAGSCPTADQPWVLTGHQVEFYHPGVWAKVIAADELARRTGGVAFDLLVDHDVVDDLGFDVPVREGDAWVRKGVHYAQASAIPADGLTPPSAESFAAWQNELHQYPLAKVDSLQHVMKTLQPAADTAHAGGYTPWLSRARRELEQSLGINVIHVPTSGLCSGEAWKHFVAAWISHAQFWVHHYNHHLARYRKRAGIKNPHHPMPDLEVHGDSIEMPFWIYKPGQPRQRMTLQSGRIVAGEKQYDLNELLAAGYVVRPRALTLTMFARLFIADAFIHGIGGALYDQITDELMQDLFSSAPPYCCVSAAWLLPLGQPLEMHDTLGHLRFERHHAEHNPDLYLDEKLARDPAVAKLLKEREHLIESIATSMQENRAGGRADRQAMFHTLHDTNAAIHAHAPEILSKLSDEIQSTLKAQRENKVLLWREYFFAMHDRQSLQEFTAEVCKR